MSDKKDKALERELMDDLMEGQTDVFAKSAVPKTQEIELDEQSQSTPASSAGNFFAQKPSEISSPKSRSEVDFSGGFPPDISVKTASEDPTIRLSATRVAAAERVRPTASPSQQVDDEVRASVGRFGAFRNTSTPTGAALAQSENLRIAQSRILELELEVERLRTENEELAAAGETFRRKSDELLSRAEDLDNRYQNAVSTHSHEKALLLENKESLRRDLDQSKIKNEELELRISTNIQKIRVRERELENRLELMKMEGAAIVRSKDEMILDLKRQIDTFNMELNNYRLKSQELNRMILDKQDILRRTVKALRLALTMLEGDEEIHHAQKKAK
jgi:hypothetical protein